jgi:hypothetical protein
MAWAYEGNEGFVPRRKLAGFKPIYRLWKKPHHVYTASASECRRLARQGHARDGVAAYVAQRAAAGRTPLYWLVSKTTGDTIFTISRGERNRLKRDGYTDKGRIGYVARKKVDGYQPLYRAHEPVFDDHLYTDDVEFIDEYGPSLTCDELEAELLDQLDDHLVDIKGFKPTLADNDYYCPSAKVAQRIVRKARLQDREYTPESFDCDDFAHLLKAAFIESIYDSGKRSRPYAMGIIWGHDPGHAMNFVVLSNGVEFEVKIIEPQEATFHTPDEDELSDIYLILG